MIPPRNTKFGFELELSGNIHHVTRELESAGYLDSSELCPYHCECERCSDWSVSLRAQTDSTCEGELISGVMPYGSGIAMFTALEAAFAQVDARVDARCGLHVHVSVDGDIPRISGVIETYCAVEEHLVRMLAPGRWSSKRTMNRTIIEGVRAWVQHVDYVGGEVDWGRGRDAVYQATQYDRHMDLNFDKHRTRTVEYRLWNATMMAWRLELACRLSCWLAVNTLTYRGLSSVLEAAAHDASVNSILPSAYTWDEFVSLVGADDGTCADLMTRQATYIRERY